VAVLDGLSADLFKQWAHTHRAQFRERLGQRYVMYGEWLYAKHTVYAVRRRCDTGAWCRRCCDLVDLRRDRFGANRRRSGKSESTQPLRVSMHVP
jgi:hypothetical protein